MTGGAAAPPRPRPPAPATGRAPPADARLALAPPGFTYLTSNPQTGLSPRFQYENITFISSPSVITLTVRSSADPYLAYLAATVRTAPPPPHTPWSATQCQGCV